MERIQWRGTWGVGDSMRGLNTAHQYAYDTNQEVNLEIHWSHGEDYLTHPDDPETIVERTDWIHTRYHQQDRVKLTHVFDSDLFCSDNKNPDNNKARFYFESNAYEPDGWPSCHWIFSKEQFVPSKKKIVVWTPTHNSEAPRKWKRVLTNEDWYDIIKMLSWEGWNTIELTYRTPIRDAYKQIQEANFILCYDGMWHYIARNFAKPMLIPSWEGVTTYNTPNAIKKHSSWRYKQCIGDGSVEHFAPTLGMMKTTANQYLKRIQKYYD